MSFRGHKKNLKEIALYTAGIAIGGTSLFFFDKHIGGFRTVEGPSMRPTLNAQLYADFNDRAPISDKRDTVVFTRSVQDLTRGDIVIVKSPRTSKNIIKRVVGLEGDSVKPLGVNNIPKTTSVTIPTNHIWVESDAGFGYQDSSIFGPVETSLVQAKVKYFADDSSKFKPWSYQSVDKNLPPSVLTRLYTPSFE